jgi:molybdopterin-guanine dinucleotide biosynthesis protein A
VTSPLAFDALVLSGGAGKRMSAGAAKIDLEVGGVTLLGRALAAVDGAGVIVVVGPRRPVGRSVIFTTEEPAGSGPAAAIVHGLQFVTAELVVVLAADMPFAQTAVPKLLEALLAEHAAGAAMITDDTGRRQPLIAAYRVASLHRVAVGKDWVGASVQSLVGELHVREIDGAGVEALDCDTPEQLDAARRIV